MQEIAEGRRLLAIVGGGRVGIGGRLPCGIGGGGGITGALGMAAEGGPLVGSGGGPPPAVGGGGCMMLGGGGGPPRLIGGGPMLGGCWPGII